MKSGQTSDSIVESLICKFIIYFTITRLNDTQNYGFFPVVPTSLSPTGNQWEKKSFVPSRDD